MKYFKKMVGKRCYLSPLNPEDVEKYVLWLNDMEAAQYLTLAYQLVSLLVSLSNERETLEKFSRQGDHYAIVESKSDELLEQGLRGRGSATASGLQLTAGSFLPPLSPPG